MGAFKLSRKAWTSSEESQRGYQQSRRIRDQAEKDLTGKEDLDFNTSGQEVGDLGERNKVTEMRYMWRKGRRLAIRTKRGFPSTLPSFFLSGLPGGRRALDLRRPVGAVPQ